MSDMLASFGDRVEFGSPAALMILPLALALLVVGVLVQVIRRRWRPARTRGSAYPLIGRMRWWLASICILAVTGLAAAQPRLKYGAATFKRGSVDIPIVVDVSASMWVKDVGTSRLQVAIREALRLQTEGILQTGDRAGLFVFGGTTVRKAHLSPRLDRLTDAVQKLAQPTTLAGDSFPWDSDVAGAFEHIYQSIDAQDRLEAGASEDDWRPPVRTDRALILLSDGDFGLSQEQQQRLDTALAEFRRRGIAVYAVGIGTRTGAEMTSILDAYRPEDYDPTLASELTGQRTVLRMSTLSFLAERTGGAVFLLDDAGRSATDFLRTAVSAHRGLTFQLTPSDDGLDAWQYLLACGILIFGVAVLFY